MYHGEQRSRGQDYEWLWRMLLHPANSVAPGYQFSSTRKIHNNDIMVAPISFFTRKIHNNNVPEDALVASELSVASKK